MVLIEKPGLITPVFLNKMAMDSEHENYVKILEQVLMQREKIKASIDRINKRNNLLLFEAHLYLDKVEKLEGEVLAMKQHLIEQN